MTVQPLLAQIGVTKVDDAKWKQWTDLILAMAAEPAVVDMAEHILYIGRK